MSEMVKDGMLIDMGRSAQNKVLNVLSKKYDTIIYNDYQTGDPSIDISTVVFRANNIRSINAAFDPDYADSPNLLASKKDTVTSDLFDLAATTPVPNLRYSFAGVNAETANHSGLAEAVKMESSKNRRYSPQEIFEKTGWYKGSEGKWRFEIDDSQATLTQIALNNLYNPDNTNDGLVLGDVLNHEKLYEAYPDIAGLSIDFDYRGDARGSASLSKGVININLAKIDGDSDELLSVLVHEIQHMIQGKEKFANGGGSDVQTVDYVINDLRKQMENAYDRRVFSEYKRLSNELHDLEQIKQWSELVDYANRESITRNSKLVYGHQQYQMYKRDVWDNVGYPPKKTKVNEHRDWLQSASRFLADKMQGNAPAGEPSYIKQLRDMVASGGENALKNKIAVVERAISKTAPVRRAFEKAEKDLAHAKNISKKASWNDLFYMSLAGEIEARNVQDRRELTEDERAELLPTNFDDGYKQTMINSPIRTGSESEPFSYSFAGENAKTADKYQLATAKERLANGEDKEVVRRETGWFMGVDGKFRFEIDDSEASLNVGNMPSRKLPEIKLKTLEQVKSLHPIISKNEFNRVAPLAEKLTNAIKNRTRTQDALIKAHTDKGMSFSDAYDSTLSVFKLSDESKQYDTAWDNFYKATKESAGSFSDFRGNQYTYSEYTDFKNRVAHDIFNRQIDRLEKTDSVSSIGDLLNHDKLFLAYPELRNIRVISTNLFESLIGISGYFDGEIIAVNPDSSVDSTLKTLLHELQHATQMKEGFARGGNTNQFNGVHSDIQKAIVNTKAY